MPARNEEAQFSYDQSREKLERILSELQEQNPSIDKLGRQVKEAVSLIKECRKFLSDTETEVMQALSEVSQTPADAEPEEPPPALRDEDAPFGEDDDMPF